LFGATVLRRTQSLEGSFPTQPIDEPRDGIAPGIVQAADHRVRVLHARTSLLEYVLPEQ